MAKRGFLTYSSAIVLQAIASGHRYGFEIMEVTGLPSGTVYPALRKLERGTLVTATWENREAAISEQRPPRRYYRVSGTGAEALDAALQRFPGLSRVVPSGIETP